MYPSFDTVRFYFNFFCIYHSSIPIIFNITIISCFRRHSKCTIHNFLPYQNMHTTHYLQFYMIHTLCKNILHRFRYLAFHVQDALKFPNDLRHLLLHMFLKIINCFLPHFRCFLYFSTISSAYFLILNKEHHSYILALLSDNALIYQHKWIPGLLYCCSCH